MRILASFVALMLLLPVSLAAADQTDKQLDSLFDQLLQFDSYGDAQSVESEIWRIWSHNDDTVFQTLLSQGTRAMGRGDFGTALKKFDQLVLIAPNFAEAWNKRATLHYLMSNYPESLADIDKTLALEPRHFGALAGQGLVLGAMERFDEALLAFESALEVHPTLIGAKRNAEALRKYLKDQEI